VPTMGNLHPTRKCHAQARGRRNEVQLVASGSWDTGDGDEVAH
jgi:hypothetical protein